MTSLSRQFRQLAAFAVITTLAISPAAAMTVSLSKLPVGTDTIQIAGGCGAGMHRGPFNGCRRNFANPAAHPCPRGFHVGPGGRCRGNGR